MKKYAISVLLVCVLGLSLSGTEEQPQSPKRFHFGLGHSFLPALNGFDIFFADFGFLIVKYKNILDMRNHIVLNGVVIYDTNSEAYGIMNLIERVSFGVITRNGLFRPYAYFEGGIGVYANESKESFFSLPLAFNFGAGGGFTTFVMDNVGFFIELGTLCHILDTQQFWSSVITAGYVVHF